MFAKKDLLGTCTDGYINVDGSGDNIHYTIVWTSTLFVLCLHRENKTCKITHSANESDTYLQRLGRLVCTFESPSSAWQILCKISSPKGRVVIRRICSGSITTLLQHTHNAHLSSHSPGMSRGLSWPACTIQRCLTEPTSLSGLYTCKTTVRTICLYLNS